MEHQARADKWQMPAWDVDSRCRIENKFLTLSELYLNDRMGYIFTCRAFEMMIPFGAAVRS
jgi:hypothetical protein